MAREESREHPDTTTIRMELTAASKALEATEPGSTVLMCTASQLVQQGMTGWVHDRWRTGTGQPVENHDLCETLHRRYPSYSIERARRAGGATVTLLRRDPPLHG